MTHPTFSMICSWDHLQIRKEILQNNYVTQLYNMEGKKKKEEKLTKAIPVNY